MMVRRKDAKRPPPHVVTLATLKGGSGKSTVVRALAAHWHQTGAAPAVVDADPQETILQWHGIEGAPASRLHVVADTSEGLRETIGGLRRHYRPIVIDTPGFRSTSLIYGLAVADVAVIPCRASPDDVQVAIETYRLILELNETEERKHAPILPRVLLTMTTPRTVIARHIRSELTEAGYPVLETELTSRVAYAESALTGSMPSFERLKSPAARDIASLADELATLQGDQVAK